MPTYCYSNDDGLTEDFVFSMDDAPFLVQLSDGSLGLRDFEAEHDPRPAGSGYPFNCYAAGVHPSQIGDLRRELDGHGCRDVAITRHGDPVIESNAQYTRVKKALGIHQLNTFDI